MSSRSGQYRNCSRSTNSNDFWDYAYLWRLKQNRPSNDIPPGKLGMGSAHRDWGQWGLMDTISVAPFDPFSAGKNVYLGSLDVEIGFATKKMSDEQYDQDDLSKLFIRVNITPYLRATSYGLIILYHFSGFPKSNLRPRSEVDPRCPEYPYGRYRQVRPASRVGGERRQYREPNA